MTDSTMLANVAIGKPATQSSLSEWSTELGAGGAVTGVMPRAFGFHTDFEDRPWWMVDLLKPYPIETIIIHNRLDMCQERAADCQVEISRDGKAWSLVHAGAVWFSGGGVGAPLTLPLGCRAQARFVRVSLPGSTALHLAQVEVIAHVGADVLARYGLPNAPLWGEFFLADGKFNRKQVETYVIERPTIIDGACRLIGVKLTRFGRLGNQIEALVNASVVARHLSLKYVVVRNQGGLIRLSESFQDDGISYVSDVSDVPEPGALLAGNFFFRDHLAPAVNAVSDAERHRVALDVIRPRLMRPLPVAGDVKLDAELTIHFRAGDIFNSPADALGYTQPPLSFYTLLVRHLLDRKRIARVRLVFEDYRNPCIERLIAFLREEAIPYRIQSGTLEEDLAALMDAPLLVFGFGSFGTGVCMLSSAVDTVFCMEGFNDRDYARIPSVRRVVRVRDRDAGYTRVGAWRGTQEQFDLMLDYPESALEIDADAT
jgi:hypothetical protein